MPHATRFCLLAALLAIGATLAPHLARAAEPVYHTGTTRKMFQLTGDSDRPLHRATASQTEVQAGLHATDLGSSFEHKGNLYFLFGDTFGRPTSNGYDTLATASATTAAALTLNVPKADDGKFLILDIPGIAQGGMCVPSYGISLNDKIYIVHTTDWYNPNMERSVLARSDDDGHTWTRLYDLSAAVNHDMNTARFVNVAMAEVNAEDYPAGSFPWASGKVALIWGSGAYRASNVCLAAIPSADIETSSALRYFAGLNAGVPTWSTEETSATYLFNQPQVGEFSVAWIPQVERWVMLYNAGAPRGINMRTSALPWGTWSSSKVIMDPGEFYGIMMHVPWGTETVRKDGFYDSGRQDDWGGEYGPYLVPRFTTGDTTSCQIYYTMSTWNPYQVVLMRSEIGASLPAETTRVANTLMMPGDGDWQKSSGDFFVNFTKNSVPYISTFTTADGDAANGYMWRWLPRDTRNKRLQLSVHGGSGEVMVLSGGGDIPVEGVSAAELYPRIKAGEFGEVVHCTWGHDTNDIDVTVDWDLRPYDRANLKVVVIDHKTTPWGFLSASRMTLVRFDPLPTPTPRPTATPTAGPTATPTPTPAPASVSAPRWTGYR